MLVIFFDLFNYNIYSGSDEIPGSLVLVLFLAPDEVSVSILLEKVLHEIVREWSKLLNSDHSNIL